MNDQYNDAGTAQHPAKRPFRVFQGTFWSFFWRTLLSILIAGVTLGITAPTAFMLFFSFAIPKTQIKGVNIGYSRDAGFYKKWLPALALLYAIIILVIIFSIKYIFSDSGIHISPAKIAILVLLFIGFIFAANYAQLVFYRQLIARTYVMDGNEQKNASFKGSYWSLFIINLVAALISILTFGILVPRAVAVRRSYIAKNTEVDGYTLTGEKKFGRHYREWIPLLIVGIIIRLIEDEFGLPFISPIYSIVIAYFIYNWFFSGISIQKQND